VAFQTANDVTFRFVTPSLYGLPLNFFVFLLPFKTYSTFSLGSISHAKRPKKFFGDPTPPEQIFYQPYPRKALSAFEQPSGVKIGLRGLNCKRNEEKSTRNSQRPNSGQILVCFVGVAEDFGVLLSILAS
jgi:hypothetical protein